MSTMEHEDPFLIIKSWPHPFDKTNYSSEEFLLNEIKTNLSVLSKIKEKNPGIQRFKDIWSGRGLNDIFIDMLTVYLHMALNNPTLDGTLFDSLRDHEKLFYETLNNLKQIKNSSICSMIIYDADLDPSFFIHNVNEIIGYVEKFKAAIEGAQFKEQKGRKVRCYFKIPFGCLSIIGKQLAIPNLKMAVEIKECIALNDNNDKLRKRIENASKVTPPWVNYWILHGK